MTQEMSFDLKLARECAQAISAACGVGCVVTDARGQLYCEEGYGCASCQLCLAAGRRPEDCVQSQIYGMAEAARFGGKYIYFCPMGLTCFVSPILEDEEVTAKLTVGPFLMGDRQDFIACDLEGQMGLCGHPLENVTALLDQIPYVPAEKVTAMSNLLFMAVGFLNNVSAANRMLEVQGSTAIQGQVTAYIQQVKNDSAAPPYPLETERALLRAVRNLNKGEAQRRLNELMGYLFFSSGGDLARIKTQIYELLILISRAAIDAGASPEATLAANHQYLQGINSLQDFDGLCLWFTKVMGALMDSVFDCAGARHTSVIHQTVQYLNTHYSEKITMEKMAQQVYLSPPYFSRIFKEEMGEPFTAYLNRIRIDRSKELLRQKNIRLTDIAQLVGFEDQSYFTKVFKKQEGVPPLRYRESHTKDMKARGQEPQQKRQSFSRRK